MDALCERTRLAALRLLKSKIRRFLYETMGALDADRWAPMLLVENGFLDGAKKEWDEVLLLWNDLPKDQLLVEINASLAQACNEVSDLWYHEQHEDIRHILQRFVVGFSPESMLSVSVSV
jgi:hypothetical protein